jgi:hypothetical protein
MGARSCIYAGIGSDQPLNWSIPENVRFDDFVDVLELDPAVPDSFRIDHDVGAMLALIQASRSVGPHPAFQSHGVQLLLETPLQFPLPAGIARPPRMVCRPLVCTDENVLFKLRHLANLQENERRSL